MILRHIHKRWEALAEPHCNISVHIYCKRLEALLEATHGIKFEGAGICPKIHAANLRQPQRANGHKTCRIKIVASVRRYHWKKLWRGCTSCSDWELQENNSCLSFWHTKSTTGSCLDTTLPLVYWRERWIFFKLICERNHAATSVLKMKE